MPKRNTSGASSSGKGSKKGKATKPKPKSKKSEQKKVVAEEESVMTTEPATARLKEGEPLPVPRTSAAPRGKVRFVKPVKPVRPVVDYGDRTVVRFTPFAWSKLQFMCNALQNVVGCMGITHPDDPFLVENVALIKQETQDDWIELDGDDFTAYMEATCDPAGDFKMSEVNCARMLIYTHPTESCEPCTVAEECFAELFEHDDWAVLVTVDRTASACAILHTKLDGLEMRQQLDVAVAWDHSFPPSSHEEWLDEIRSKVSEVVYVEPPEGSRPLSLGVEGIPLKMSESKTDPVVLDRVPVNNTVKGDRGEDLLSYRDGLADENYPGYDPFDPLNSSRIPLEKVKRAVTVHPRIKVIPSRWIFYRMRSAMTAERLAFEPIKDDDLLMIHISDLKEVGVEVDSRLSPSGVIFRIVKDNAGKPIPLATQPKVTSDQLAFIGGQPYDDLTDELEGELKQAEDELWDAIRERIEDKAFITADDAFDNFLAEVFPWKCVDGTCMWVSIDEMDILLEIAAGEKTAMEVFPDLDLTDSTNSDDDDDDDANGATWRDSLKDPIDALMYDVSDALEINGQETKENIEDALEPVQKKCDEAGLSLEFAIALMLVRQVDYDPTEFEHQFRTVGTSLIVDAVGRIAQRSAVKKRDELTGLKVAIKAILLRSGGVFTLDCETEVAELGWEYQDLGLRDEFILAADLVKEVDYDADRFEDSFDGRMRAYEAALESDDDPGLGEERSQVLEETGEVNEALLAEEHYAQLEREIRFGGGASPDQLEERNSETHQSTLFDVDP